MVIDGGLGGCGVAEEELWVEEMMVVIELVVSGGGGN